MRFIRASLSALAVAVVLGSLALSPAPGQKAGPLELEFADGNPVASIERKLSGDLELEASFAAKKGQWVMVEIASAPRDAAIFTVRDPAGNESQGAYAWSTLVERSGEYVVTVRRPPDYPACAFTLKVARSARPASLKTSPTDKDAATLDAAMRKFVGALRSKDRAAFLDCFSKTAPFSALNPMNAGAKDAYRVQVSYAELASDLNKKDGLYWIYLERGEGGDMDAFVDNAPDGAAWTRVNGNKYVPPGGEFTSSTYVRWRKEAGRWVVDEISYAQA